jgi:hypothetical protein
VGEGLNKVSHYNLNLLQLIARFLKIKSKKSSTKGAAFFLGRHIELISAN